MEIMRLKTNDRIYNVFSDNINEKNFKIYGYIYENNQFYPLNEDVYNELNKLKIGNNTKKIDTYESDNLIYDVILDLDTNLKHYFLDGKENYSLFINNFEDVIIADNRNIKYTDNLADENKKLDITVRFLKAASLSLLILVESSFVSKLVQLIDNNNKVVQTTSISNPIEQTEVTTSASIEIDIDKSEYLSELMNNTPTLTSEIISDLIKNNKNITDSDKEILLNSGIIEFASQYINENKEFAAKLYNVILPNFTIVEKDLGEQILGSWDHINYIMSINVKLIKKYNESDFKNQYKKVMLHEFAHLFQPLPEYRFLTEGCAQIIENEFHKMEIVEKVPEYRIDENTGAYIAIGTSNYTVILPNKYSYITDNESKYTAILMEIIGKELVIRYNFTDNIEPIKEELEKYLSKEDVNDLLEIYKKTGYDITKNDAKEQWQQNISNMKAIYSRLYYNKYHRSMRANSAINEYLNSADDSFCKYYFNNCDEHNYDSDLYDLENYKLAKNNYFPAYNQVNISITVEDLNNILDFESIKQSFYSNPNLTKEEKNMLFNEEFIKDYINYKKIYLDEREGKDLQYLNHCTITQFLENLRITNDDRGIIGSDPDDEFSYRISATDLYKPEIAINEKNCYQYASKNNLSYNDVYKKEMIENFVKIFPENYNNDILNNACTDIILKEYYGIELPKKDNISIMEDKATKMLIDLIGSEPLKYYYFTGSDKLIREQMALLGNVEVDNTLNILEQTVSRNDDIDSIKFNLSSILLYLYNIKNNINTSNLNNLATADYEKYINYVNNYMDNYYIPETKGYFSDSYIEKDKINHPENYNNITSLENENLGKKR